MSENGYDMVIDRIKKRKIIQLPEDFTPEQLDIYARGYLDGTVAAVDAVEDLKEEMVMLK